MGGWLRELRLAGRRLVRSPGFAVAAVLCLALGIGANSAVFSVVHGVLLRPLAYQEPERLVMVWGEMLAEDRTEMPASGAEFLDYREQGTSFVDAAAIVNRFLNLTGRDEPERLVAGRVSASLFPLLGVEAAHGRTFLPEEDRRGNEKVVVLSHGLWQRRFASDPDVIGDTVTLSDQPFTVVGVMPADFSFKFEAFEHQLWIPIAIDLENLPPRDFRGLRVVARVRADVSLAQAQAEMDALAGRFSVDYPDIYPPDSGWGIRLVPVLDQIVGDVRPALLAAMGAVALVLLIACANVGNLILARTVARQREVAVRTALGAGRRHLIRQTVAETALLVATGGALGLLGAFWGVWLLGRLDPAGLPRGGDVAVGDAVILFTLAVALATGLLFGVAPVLRLARLDPGGALREAERGSQSRARRRLRSALVVAEVAMALVVLVAAGLLLRSLLRVVKVDPGFEPRGVLTAQLYLSPNQYPQGADQAQAGHDILARLRELPEVSAAGGVTGLPLSEVQFIVETVLEDHVVGEGRADPAFDWRPATPGYFEALGIPLEKGRLFDARDHDEAQPVAIVDSELVRRFWEGQDPIGKRLKIAVGQPAGEAEWRTVVGVVGHVRSLSLEGSSPEQVYTPLSQTPFPFLSVALRAGSDPLALAPAVRQAVWATDPNQPIDHVRSMEDILAEATSGRRAYATMLGLFAAVALVLATVGVYGVMAYTVAQRNREIGVRMAMGAHRGDVLRLVVRQGLGLTGLGIILGAVGAVWAGRALAGLLFRVDPFDPATFAAVALLLAAVALVATWLPARRAARVEPAVSLRVE